MRLAFSVCLSAAWLVSGLSGQEKKTALDQLQGTWAVVAMERDGRPAPKDYCDTLQVTIAGDKMTFGFKNGKGPVIEHQIRLDPKNPKVMDLVVPAGQGKGKVLLGIYELDGKTLKMCHADAGAKDRPTEYKSPRDTYHSVVVATRTPK